VETKAEVEVIVVGHVEAEGEVARAGRMEVGAKVEVAGVGRVEAEGGGR
jgi:hypothetical protein